MSTEGLGTVLLMPAAALVGTGVLIAQGLMWCGKKMKERYETASQSYNTLAQAAFEEQQAQQEDRKFIVTAMIEQFTSGTNLRLYAPAEQNIADEIVIKSMLERAQNALSSSEMASRLKAEHEQARFRRTLEAEIVASQGIAPTETLAAAKAAFKPLNERYACGTTGTTIYFRRGCKKYGCADNTQS